MNSEKEIRTIVMKLQKGDQSQFDELYDLTNASAMVVARKYLKQKADCEDVVQEAYITALNKINDLQKPESFSSWLNQIVATKSLNVLRKKNPVMFSEMTAEEDDADIDFEDESPQFSPEKITDMEAVSSAVSEVMDSLPEMQRDALWMHYGQDIPIKDIAEAAGVSENTIKSRLKQGREKLSRQKEEFRKRGIEISVVTIATLLYTLFNKDIEVQAQDLAASTEYVKESTELKKKIDTKRSSVHTKQNLHKAGKAVKHTAVKTGLSTGVKAAIAVAAVAAGVGSGTVIYNVQSNQNTSTAVKETAAPQTKKKASSASKGKNSSASKETASSETKKKATPTPQTQKNEEALKQYQAILAKASSMGSFTSYSTPSGEYIYALITMQKGEGPTLLLAQGVQDDGTYNARVYYYDEDTGTMYQTQDTIEFGTASVGGFRGVMNKEPDGNGIQQIAITTKETYTIRYTRSGNTLNQGTDGSSQKGETIQWYALNDDRALKQWPQEVKATGEDGFPAEGSTSAGTSEAGTSTANQQTDSGKGCANSKIGDMSGTYRSDDGDEITVKDHCNFRWNVNGVERHQSDDGNYYNDSDIKDPVVYYVDLTPRPYSVVRYNMETNDYKEYYRVN